MCMDETTCQLIGKTAQTNVLQWRTKTDWATIVKEISDQYDNDQKITLMMDNLNFYHPSALYRTYPP